MRARPSSLLALTALLAGCGLPEARLRAGLVNAGLSPPIAGCMAHRLAERLSLAQLRRIGDLPVARESLSVSAFLHDLRALGDPEILGVATGSAALCATGIADRASPVTRPRAACRDTGFPPSRDRKRRHGLSPTLCRRPATL